MSDQFEMLEVVDENDNVIGLETREKIHKEGLLHREIHIFFITPKGEIIFQHRSKNKSMSPDKLDATVGGHVTPGMSYDESAIKECKEETGIDINKEDLVFLVKIKKHIIAEVDNNTIRSEYSYLYKEPIERLKVEGEEALGFESWPIEKLSHLSPDDKIRFVQTWLSDEFLSLFNKAKELLIK